MKTIKKLFFVMLVFALAAVGCKKTDEGGDNPPAPTKKTCYINKIDEGSDGYSTITYDANHLITSAVNYDSNGVADGTVTNFTYDGKKLKSLISLDNGTVDSKIEFTYSGSSTPDSAVIYSDNGSGVLVRDGAYSLTFNGDKLIKKEMKVSYSGQSIVISKTEYAYTNDNNTEIKSYNINSSLQLELNSTETLEYDSKKNALHGIGLDFFFFGSDMPFMSVNNITKYTYKDGSGVVDISMSYTNTIEYNSNDYPTKITTNYNSGNKTDIVEYTYDCQ